MRNWYRHNDNYYIVHRQIKIADFSGKNGVVNMEMVKECRDVLPNVDHVLNNGTHFMFVETDFNGYSTEYNIINVYNPDKLNYEVYDQFGRTTNLSSSGFKIIKYENGSISYRYVIQ